MTAESVNWDYVEAKILGTNDHVYYRPLFRKAIDDYEAMDEQIYAILRGWA